MMKRFVQSLALMLVTVLLCGVLTSCSRFPDSTKAEEALVAAEYTVTFGDSGVISTYMSMGIDLDEKLMARYSVYDTSTRTTIVQYAAVYYFADAENAKKAMEHVVTDAAAEKSDEYTDWVEPTRSGSIIYYGTPAAIEAAKK